ncbi:hypothetical protein BDK51DRAFT_42402 [Blyttiomyces helicus]|uniref:Uncharacterized protein n=1 Tax=Blyttiomyces helicus TaxID=388810 RepID=A0A4P9WIY5_9FUNG|nr:hypothetical protein BDK51DRAFT_42402 [Blyttiomyces helicus]|eukprot:RKO92774.1 hypothetical protein BDK51DRAFT_42402 [Blyttiomyces helicus]
MKAEASAPRSIRSRSRIRDDGNASTAPDLRGGTDGDGKSSQTSSLKKTARAYSVPDLEMRATTLAMVLGDRVPDDDTPRAVFVYHYDHSDYNFWWPAILVPGLGYRRRNMIRLDHRGDRPFSPLTPPPRPLPLTARSFLWMRYVFSIPPKSLTSFSSIAGFHSDIAVKRALAFFNGEPIPNWKFWPRPGNANGPRRPPRASTATPMGDKLTDNAPAEDGAAVEPTEISFVEQGEVAANPSLQSIPDAAESP